MLQASSPWIIPIPYIRTSDKSTVIIKADDLNGINLDVTVPTITDLKLTTNSSPIVVNGVTGQLVLISNSGNITLTNSHPQGPSLLQSNSGSVTAKQDLLVGQVTFDNNSGAIIFDGSIDPQGTYQFIANGGAIDCTLPLTARFHLDAKTNSSTVTSDFPNIHVVNNEIHADIGKPASALISLTNNSGTINIRP